MNFKSLVLGAAGIVAASGAFAADLPIAPEPVDYVRVCDAYGTGFFYLPGTETCIKIGTRVRVDLYFDDNGLPQDAGNFAHNYTSTLARGYIRVDTRTNTEFGLLRTYVDFQMTENSYDANAYNLEYAFIQLGGLTAGHTGSMFDFYTGSVYELRFDQSLSDRTTNLWAYTAAFGNGFSATLSIEDGTFRRKGIRNWNGANVYGGHRWPDFVANLRVDQGWGAAQIMAALHDVRDGVPANDDSETGWAIGAGVTINLPMLAPGDSVSFQAAYADGAVDYVLPSTEFNRGLWDAARRPTGPITTTEAWSIGGGFTHFWTPAVSTGVTVTYADVDQTWYNIFGTAFNNIGDFEELDLQANLVWRPVSGLQIGAEVNYVDVDRAVGADYDDWGGGLRIQADF